jgi:hypothetical protein
MKRYTAETIQCCIQLKAGILGHFEILIDIISGPGVALCNSVGHQVPGIFSPACYKILVEGKETKRKSCLNTPGGKV